MDAVLEQLASSNPLLSTNAAKVLLDTCHANNGALMVANLPKFFSTVNDQLSKGSHEVIASLLKLLLEIIPGFGPDLEAAFTSTLRFVVLHLKETPPNCGHLAQKVLSEYARATGNAEAVATALCKWGFHNTDFRVRTQAVAYIGQTLDRPLSANSPHIKKVVEELLTLLRDPSSHVIDQARKTLAWLAEAPGFSQVFAKLSYPYKQLFQERIGAVRSEESPALKSDKHFGFVPEALFQQLTVQSEWKERVAAVHELEKLVDTQLKQPASLPYASALYRFLNTLLSDTNFKVTLSVVRMIEAVLQLPGASRQVNVALVIPQCLMKLGDVKITIRQAVFRLFKLLLSEARPSALIPQLVEALDSNNWHVREEVANLFIVGMLTLSDDYAFDFSKLVAPLAKLLDDSKTKVKFVATEALAVCAQRCGADVVSEKLRPIVATGALQSIEERLKCKLLPVVHDEFIEFPRTIPSSAPAISSPYLTATNFRTTSIIRLKDLSATTPIYSPDSIPQPAHTPRITKRGGRTESEKPQVRLSYASQYTWKHKEPKPTARMSAHTPVLRALAKELPAPEQPVYLSKDQLEPMANPEEVLQRCLIVGQLGDWSVQFDTINNIRRLLAHHSGVFHVSLHNLVLDLCNWADSLRSSLSKNGLIAIGELCESLGRRLDNEVAELLKISFKKVIDTNSFIAEEAVRALEAICKHLAVHKVLAYILSNTHRNASIKAQVCSGLAILFGRGADKLKDFNAAVKLLGTYASDASPLVRASAKQSFEELAKVLGPQFEAVLSQNFNDTTLRRITDLLQKVSRPLKKTRTQYTMSRAGTGKVVPIENLEKIETDLQSSDWKTRYDALGELVNALPSFCSSAQCLKVADLLCKALQDQNLKVNVHALNSAKKIIPVLNRGLDPHLGSLCDALKTGLGSGNSSIREIAREVCSGLCAQCSATALLPALVTSFVKANPRAKTALLSFIIELVPEVAAQRPVLLHKHLLPILPKLLENKHNLEGTYKLVQTLHSILGNATFEGIPSTSLPLMQEILGSVV